MCSNMYHLFSNGTNAIQLFLRSNYKLFIFVENARCYYGESGIVCGAWNAIKTFFLPIGHHHYSMRALFHVTLFFFFHLFICERWTGVLDNCEIHVHTPTWIEFKFVFIIYIISVIRNGYGCCRLCVRRCRTVISTLIEIAIDQPITIEGWNVDPQLMNNISSVSFFSTERAILLIKWNIREK